MRTFTDFISSRKYAGLLSEALIDPRNYSFINNWVEKELIRLGRYDLYEWFNCKHRLLIEADQDEGEVFTSGIDKNKAMANELVDQVASKLVSTLSSRSEDKSTLKNPAFLGKIIASVLDKASAETGQQAGSEFLANLFNAITKYRGKNIVDAEQGGRSVSFTSTKKDLKFKYADIPGIKYKYIFNLILYYMKYENRQNPNLTEEEKLANIKAKLLNNIEVAPKKEGDETSESSQLKAAITRAINLYKNPDGQRTPTVITREVELKTKEVLDKTVKAKNPESRLTFLKQLYDIYYQEFTDGTPQERLDNIVKEITKSLKKMLDVDDLPEKYKKTMEVLIKQKTIDKVQKQKKLDLTDVDQLIKNTMKKKGGFAGLYDTYLRLRGRNERSGKTDEEGHIQAMEDIKKCLPDMQGTEEQKAKWLDHLKTKTEEDPTKNRKRLRIPPPPPPGIMPPFNNETADMFSQEAAMLRRQLKKDLAQGLKKINPKYRVTVNLPHESRSPEDKKILDQYFTYFNNILHQQIPVDKAGRPAYSIGVKGYDIDDNKKVAIIIFINFNQKFGLDKAWGM